MQPSFAQPGHPEQPLPLVVIGVRVERLASRAGEHPALGLPESPHPLAVPLLLGRWPRSSATSWSGRPIVRRPALDLTSPVAWRTFIRCGQSPGACSQVPSQPCAYLGRSRERRTRSTPWSRSTSSHRRPSASPCRSPSARARAHRALLRRSLATPSKRWISSMPYGSTSFSSSFGALARSTGLRLKCDRLTASLSAPRLPPSGPRRPPCGLTRYR